MAWLCSARTNTQLVANLADAGILSSPRCITAMRAVDRAHFTRTHRADLSYADSPQYLGHKATISAPHMHAYALELLEPYLHAGGNALDVGAGSGYLAACFSELVKPGGKVVAIEHIPELVEVMQHNLERWDADCLNGGRIVCVAGDGRLGYEQHAPYAAIHVGAAAATIPQHLIDQLARPGRMVVPVGPEDGNQRLVQVDKDEHGEVKQTRLMGVCYVPLTDREHQVGQGEE